MSQVPIRAIWVFHTAARAGSISRAAEELSVTPSAVTQQIQSLESQLGVTLLTKVGRGIVLTEAGERYFSSITEGVERIAEATGTIRGYRSITTLSVRATPTLSNKWLLPRLSAFLDDHPDLEVRLDGTNEPTDFSRELVDLEIRHGDGKWPGLFVEGLDRRELHSGVRSLLCRGGQPRGRKTARLSADPLGKVAGPVAALVHAGRRDPRERWRRVLFDRSHMAIDAACDGMGIALESTMMMERELKSGRLVCPVRHTPQLSLVTQWIVCPRDHLRHKKVRTFLDWLRAQRAGAP